MKTSLWLARDHFKNKFPFLSLLRIKRCEVARRNVCCYFNYIFRISRAGAQRGSRKQSHFRLYFYRRVASNVRRMTSKAKRFWGCKKKFSDGKIPFEGFVGAENYIFKSSIARAASNTFHALDTLSIKRFLRSLALSIKVSSLG